eukprot:3955240-Amphidinium_carterae.2
MAGLGGFMCTRCGQNSPSNWQPELCAHEFCCFAMSASTADSCILQCQNIGAMLTPHIVGSLPLAAPRSASSTAPVRDCIRRINVAPQAGPHATTESAPKSTAKKRHWHNRTKLEPE